MNFDRVQLQAFVVGLIALVAAGSGAFVNPQEFFRSYLLGYLFWLSLALGSLSIALLHNLVGGRWGVGIRLFLESGMRTLPLMAVLLIPILAGIPVLYEWAHPDIVARDAVLMHKAPYLNAPFFIVRSVGYFVIWLALAMLLPRWSGSGRAFSGPGIIVFSFATSFAAMDWVMSLEPHWFSTIYGAIFLVGLVVETFAFCIVLLALFVNRPPFAGRIDSLMFHDLGNLMLAFVCLWAYTSFSQFLIIWSGNIPEETPWYIRRTHAGWQFFSVALMVFHFAVPFAILLSRDIKRNASRIGAVALLVFLVRLVDLVYWIEPAFPETRWSLLWMPLVASVGIGGFWVAVFLQYLKRTPLLDIHDARLYAEGGHS